MRVNKCCKGLLLASGLLWWGTSGAALLNGDFSTDFSSWKGEVEDLGFSVTPLDPLPNLVNGNFSIVSGAAVLTTSSDAATPNDIWSVHLFQDFIVPTLSALGSTLELSLDLSSTVSDAMTDFVFAQLEDLADPLLTIDLLAGSPVDITAWAGRSASISFGVEDGDDTNDNLTIDNIQITEKIVTVPAPATLLLLATGLVGLWLGRIQAASQTS